MLVSWDWLGEYLDLADTTPEEVATQLTMSGLNLEEIRRVDGDAVLDLEVTSNRPDCLGHLGIAREIAVLRKSALKVPNSQPPTISTSAGAAVKVSNQAPQHCPQYHARVIRGVKVGPSPAWLQKRLNAVGIACINNVVDITNYVMLECAQPLHAFDLDRIRGGEIQVRTALAGETIKAINQRDYKLDPSVLVIADRERPVAIAGVMGGFETEISTATTNVLIEAAQFSPLIVRNTARALSLQSPSSHRFERALDPLGPEYASRRCAELILKLAGGELLAGSVVAGEQPAPPAPVCLRFRQFRRILGIDIPADRAVEILTLLGLTLVERVGDTGATFLPPSGRRDLTREIDLVEEVSRIHGYDHLPQDVQVPLCSSSKSRRDRVTERLQQVLVGSGFLEALTVSFVSSPEREYFTPFADRPPLFVEHSTRRQENLLRQSLIPSLLVARLYNERHGQHQADLFEIAKVYLSADGEQPEHLAEPSRLGLVAARPFAELKGVLEALIARLGVISSVELKPSTIPQFTPGRGCEVYVDGRFLGWLGELAKTVGQRLGLRDSVCVAELDVHTLDQLAVLIPKVRPLPVQQPVSRDLNLVLAEQTPWVELVEVIRAHGGPHLEDVRFSGQYRGQQIAAGSKSYLASLVFRAAERTLTGEEVDAAVRQVIEACQSRLQATLRA